MRKLFEKINRQNVKFSEMKNPLKIQPEDWIKEREIGQFSFVLKRAIIFTLILLPIYFVFDYFLSLINEDWRLSGVVRNAVISGLTLSVSERYGLESEYRKLVKNKT